MHDITDKCRSEEIRPGPFSILLTLPVFRKAIEIFSEKKLNMFHMDVVYFNQCMIAEQTVGCLKNVFAASCHFSSFYKFLHNFN